MPNILIRDLPEETKRRLEARAAEHGRSQNAEAVAILEEALAKEEKTWFDLLREAVDEVGGIELELPERHPAREFSFEGVS